MTHETPPDTPVSPEAPPKTQQVSSRIKVEFQEHTDPFVPLALYELDAAPRPGDLIGIPINGNVRVFRVEFINIFPFHQVRQIVAGVSLNEQLNAPTPPTVPFDLKERMDQAVKANIQVFEKAQAYSTAMVAVGYAGLIALWSFSKPIMTPRTTAATIILIGVSLLAYVTWEIGTMISRAISMARFVELIHKNPNEYFTIQAEQEAKLRGLSARFFAIWKWVLIPTVGGAFFAGLIILHNAARTFFA